MVTMTEVIKVAHDNTTYTGTPTNTHTTGPAAKGQGRECEDPDFSVTGIQCDVSDQASVQSLVDQVYTKYGKVNAAECSHTHVSSADFASPDDQFNRRQSLSLSTRGEQLGHQLGHRPILHLFVCIMLLPVHHARRHNGILTAGAHSHEQRRDHAQRQQRDGPACQLGENAEREYMGNNQWLHGVRAEDESTRLPWYHHQHWLEARYHDAAKKCAWAYAYACICMHACMHMYACMHATGITTPPGNLAYNVSKAAVKAYTGTTFITRICFS